MSSNNIVKHEKENSDAKRSSPLLECINVTLLLLLLSSFSCVRLCATPEMAAHQTPLSLRFSRQEGVGCHCLLQCMKVKSESEVAQLCPTPSDPMDCSPPGSSDHGILQVRVLEWGAIAFSSFESLLLSCPTLCDPIDLSPPGSTIPGIPQERLLE